MRCLPPFVLFVYRSMRSSCSEMNQSAESIQRLARNAPLVLRAQDWTIKRNCYFCLDQTQSYSVGHYHEKGDAARNYFFGWTLLSRELHDRIELRNKENAGRTAGR